MRKSVLTATEIKNFIGVSTELQVVRALKDDKRWAESPDGPFMALNAFMGFVNEIDELSPALDLPESVAVIGKWLDKACTSDYASTDLPFLIIPMERHQKLLEILTPDNADFAVKSLLEIDDLSGYELLADVLLSLSTYASDPNPLLSRLTADQFTDAVQGYIREYIPDDAHARGCADGACVLGSDEAKITLSSFLQASAGRPDLAAAVTTAFDSVSPTDKPELWSIIKNLRPTQATTKQMIEPGNASRAPEVMGG